MVNNKQARSRQVRSRRWAASITAVAVVAAMLVIGATPAAAVDVPPVPTSAVGLQGHRLKVVTDAAGNTYYTGVLWGTGVYGTGPNAVAYSAGGTTGDAFVSSFDAAGAFRWVIIGSNVLNPASVNDLATDGVGGIYVSGTFERRVTFGTTTIGNGFDRHGFLLKVTDAGVLSWVKDLTGAAGTFPTLDRIAASPSGVYLTGTFQASLRFSPTLVLTRVGAGGFLAHYDSAGSSPWAQSLPSARDVAILPSGDAVVLGSFSGNLTLGAFTLTSLVSTQVFLARVTPTGSYPWARSIGDPQTSDHPVALSTDASGRVSVAVVITGTARFGLLTVTKSPNGGVATIAMARYTTNGSVQWARRFAWAYTHPYAHEMVMTTRVDGSVVAAFDYTANPSYQPAPRFGDVEVLGHGSGSVSLAAIADDGTFLWAQDSTTGAISDVIARPAGGFAAVLAPGNFKAGPSDIEQLTLPNAGATSFIVEFPHAYIGPGQNLGVSVTGPTEAVLGQDFTLTITARNGGPDPTANPVVSGLTSAGLVVVSAVPSKGTVAGNTWSVGPMADHETATLTLTVRKAITSSCEGPPLTLSIGGAPGGVDLEAADNTATHAIAYSQPPQSPGGGLNWAQAVHGVSKEGVTDLAVNEAGQVYATGHFAAADSVFAPSTPQETVIDGSIDKTFLARYDGDGTLVWLRRIAGPLADVAEGFSVRDVEHSELALAPDGTPLVGGTANTGARFDGASAVPQSPPIVGGYVAHYTADGVLDWVTPTGFRALDDLAVAADGSIFAIGTTVLVAGIGGSVTESWVVKLSSTGDLLWSSKMGSSAVAVGVDETGIVRTVSNLRGTATYGPSLTAITLTSDGESDAVLADYDDAGALLATTPIGDTAYAAGFHEGSWYAYGSTAATPPWLRRLAADGTVLWSTSTGTVVDTGAHTRGHVAFNAGAVSLTASNPVQLGFGFSLVGSSGSSVFALYAPADGTLLHTSASGVASLASAFGPGDRLFVGGRYSVDVARLGTGPSTNWAMCNRSGTQWGLWDEVYRDDDAFLAGYTLEGSVGGTVTDGAGSPMAGITVTVMGEWPSWVVAGTATTGADGTWRIDDLAVGRYRVRFRDLSERKGWLWSTASPTYKAASNVVVPMAETATIDVALPAFPDTVVAGRVTDQSTGLPLAGAHVAVFDDTGFVMWATTGTNGYYGIRGLPSKQYKLWVLGPERSYVSEWFNDKPTAALATSVVVGAPGTSGSRVQANVALAPKT